MSDLTLKRKSSQHKLLPNRSIKSPPFIVPKTLSKKASSKSNNNLVLSTEEALKKNESCLFSDVSSPHFLRSGSSFNKYFAP